MLNKYYFAALTLFVLTSCAERKVSNSNKIIIFSYTIEESNKLVYGVRNKSGNNVLLLNYFHEIYPIVYEMEKDSSWLNISDSFYYSMRKLIDTSEIYKTNKEEFYEYDKAKPETFNFYNMVVSKIEKDSLSVHSDLIWEIDDLIYSSLYLKCGEEFCDTISISNFRKKYPDKDLKFVSAYPKIYIDETNMTYLEFYINSFLSDSLGVKLPTTLDGYKVIYDIFMQNETKVLATK